MKSWTIFAFLILSIALVTQVKGLYSVDHVLGFLRAGSNVHLLGAVFGTLCFQSLFMLMGAAYLGFWEKVSGRTVVFTLFRFLVVPYAVVTCVFRFNPNVLTGNYSAILITILLSISSIAAMPRIFELTEEHRIWENPKNQNVFLRYPPRTRGDIWLIDVLFFVAFLPFSLLSG